MNHKNNRRAIGKVFRFLFSMIILIQGTNSVLAISGDGLIAYPTNPNPQNPATNSWFVYELDRGESKEDSLTIKNESDQKITARIYPVDATVNNMGGFALKAEKDKKDAIGKWIKLEEETVVLDPQSEKKVKFKITIPSDAISGEIAGGIIIQKEASQEQANVKSGFIINTRIGIRVYETVPGEITQKVAFGDASLQYDKKQRSYVLNVVVKNESNVSIEPDVKVKIKDMFFNTQNQMLEQKTSIPREGQVKAAFTFKEPKIGKFDVVPELTYQTKNGKENTVISPQTFSFWALPWDELIIITLLILANVIFLLILKIISKKEKKYYKDYRVKSGDSLQTIAGKLGTSWKKIANINKIKSPYQITEGQIITVFDKKDMLEQLYMENEKLKMSEENLSFDKSKGNTWEKWSEEKSAKESFLIRISKELKLRKDICIMIIIGIIFLATGYFLYVSLFMQKNSTSFSYEKNDVLGSSDKDLTKSQPQEEKPQDDIAKQIAQTNEPANAEREPVTDEAPVEEISTADKEKTGLEILNGSGIKGASSKILTVFTVEGYKNILAGNADNFNYDKTLIICPPDIKEEICKDVKNILSKDYPNVDEKRDSNTGGKIRIILGK